MDSAFQLEGVARATFFQSVMEAFGCTYICLWSYSQQSNCLVFLDGLYHEEVNNQSQASSSSGNLAQRLFHVYSQSFVPIVEFDRVPGLAFRNGQQYLEVNESELHRLAAGEPQRLFYQEARIKTAVFMACKSGEIELGLTRGSQGNMEMEMRNVFQKEFMSDAGGEHAATGRPSSSSSSIRSLSIDSPSEFSSLLFNINNPTTTSPPTLSETPLIDIAPTSLTTAPTATTATTMHLQAFHDQLQNIGLPITQQTEQEAITRAILAVLTSSTSSSSSSQQQQLRQLSQQSNLVPAPPKSSAFRNYKLNLAPKSQISSKPGTGSLLKQAISYYRRLNMARRQYPAVASRPTSTQLHHMISERKRREKLSESFQSLRSLLPPGTKKDKASLLISTRDYLNSLKAQVDELSRRNKILEAQVLPPPSKLAEAESSSSAPNTEESDRVRIRVTPVSESTSERRIIDVYVTVRGNCPTLDLVIRILEFQKGAGNLSLVSMEANTQMAEDSTSFNGVTLRLRIEGNDWDESAFGEAVKRVVADLAK